MKNIKPTITDEYLEYHGIYEKKYKEKTLVLMQVGSFYEAYATNENGPNLQNISELLNIICTRKNKSIKEISLKNPYMLGFPIVAFNKYINILIESGYTVILVDQVTPPPEPKREVTNVYSPGTYVNGPQKSDSNYVCCIYLAEELQKNGKYLVCSGMAGIDLTTGKVVYYESISSSIDDKLSLDDTIRFISSTNPREVILAHHTNDKYKKEQTKSYLELENRIIHQPAEIEKRFLKLSYQCEFLKKIYKDTAGINPIEYLELERYPYATIALLMIMDFAYEHSEKIVRNLQKPEIFFDSQKLILGNNAVYQLNILESSYNSQGYGNSKIKSLFDVVNNTSTPLGRRFLKERLASPLVSAESLKTIYDNIEQLIRNKNYMTVESHLSEMSDIERLERKIALSFAQPYEMADFIRNYQEISKLTDSITKLKILKNVQPEKNMINKLNQFIEECIEYFDIEKLKVQNLSLITSNLFNEGIYPDLDELQKKKNMGTLFMENLCDVLSKYLPDGQQNNKHIPKITIKNSDKEGYYLVLSKNRSKILQDKLSKIPEIDIKINNQKLKTKQLVFNDQSKQGSKIMIPDLANHHTDIDKARDELDNLCRKYFQETCRELFNKYKTLYATMNSFIAHIDYLKSNTKTARLYNYCRPEIVTQEDNNNSFIEVTQLRHPIVERIIDYEYVPHDVSVGDKLKGMLIFGLNGAGKSLIMKAIGLSVVMAQAGLYVPAKSCKFSPYHSLYTRITGHDNLFKGLSSFTLEMLELKAIMKRSTPNTLVIGDEICRGTEHVSGTAIVAASILELEKSGATFIFATHLHEIAQMEVIKKLNTVQPFHISVHYDAVKDILIYDRQLKQGSGDNIYGITVAKYILNDQSFIDTAMKIKNDLTKSHGTLLSGKTSRYNSQVFVDECQLCGKKDTTGFIGPLQTHHINFQKDCEDGFAKDKTHIAKNSKANLIVICAECHDKVHHDHGDDHHDHEKKEGHGTIELEGYVMTSKGKQIKIKNKSN
jgi:DNA mismatch repair protein MutS